MNCIICSCLVAVVKSYVIRRVGSLYSMLLLSLRMYVHIIVILVLTTMVLKNYYIINNKLLAHLHNILYLTIKVLTGIPEIPTCMISDRVRSFFYISRWKTVSVLTLKWIMCLLMIGEFMLIFHNRSLKSSSKSRVILF